MHNLRTGTYSFHSRNLLYLVSFLLASRVWDYAFFGILRAALLLPSRIP